MTSPLPTARIEGPEEIAEPSQRDRAQVWGHRASDLMSRQRSEAESVFWDTLADALEKAHREGAELNAKANRSRADRAIAEAEAALATERARREAAERERDVARSGLEEIASVLDSHWRGAGVALSPEWIIREIVGIVNDADADKDRADAAEAKVASLTETVGKLTALSKRRGKALRYYGMTHIWKAGANGELPVALSDAGKRARAALSPTEPAKE